MTDTALAVEVLKRMSAQDETLSEIHKQTMKTNGRVTGLEMREAAREAVRIDRAERLKETTANARAKGDRRIVVLSALCGLSSGGLTLLVTQLL
jgi:hypothetical protein